VKEFPEGVLQPALLARVTEIRVDDPQYAFRVARSRERRASLTRNGKLNILAADHPARRVTGVGGDSLGMADRNDYLTRIVRVLMSDAVDGVMATMDIIEDLLVLHDLSGRNGFLKDKVLIASLNRGGLAGTSWEMNDPMTGATPESCAAWNLDGAKILMRLCDEEPDSLKTMVASATAINQANALHLPTFLEPLPVVKTEKGYKVIKTAEALAKIVGVASALGDSSRYLWLKLPYCDNYEVVARSTTLPILLLGGESTGDPAGFLREVFAGMASGANVRGALVGRNVLYPGDADPLAVARAVGGIVHQGWTVEQAIESRLDRRRG
jgi:DhnA family fructose-bisphosphate aldolase class Ia